MPFTFKLTVHSPKERELKFGSEDEKTTKEWQEAFAKAIKAVNNEKETPKLLETDRFEPIPRNTVSANFV